MEMRRKVWKCEIHLAKYSSCQHSVCDIYTYDALMSKTEIFVWEMFMDKGSDWWQSFSREWDMNFLPILSRPLVHCVNICLCEYLFVLYPQIFAVVPVLSASF